MSSPADTNIFVRGVVFATEKVILSFLLQSRFESATSSEVHINDEFHSGGDGVPEEPRQRRE